MSQRKWLPKPMRNMKLRSGVWYLYEKLETEQAELMGKKHIVHRLDTDLSKAIVMADKIRNGPTLEEEIERISQIEDEVDQFEHAALLAELRGDPKIELKARGLDASLMKVAEVDRDTISEATFKVRTQAVARSGLRYLSDCQDRRQAHKIIEGLTANGLSRNTASLTARTLSTLYRIAIDRGWWNRPNPFERLGIKKGKTSKRALEPSEVQAATARADALGAALITFLSVTGLRIGEALALKDEGKTISIKAAKTQAGIRTLPISKRCRDALDVIQREATSYDRCHDAVKAAYSVAGIQNADVHSLRRTCATALQRCSVPEATAAAILGHSYRQMSFGHYSAGPSEGQLRSAMGKVERFLFK